MSDLWTPEHLPPQVSDTAIEKIEAKLFDKGLSAVYFEGVEVFGLRHRPLGQYVRDGFHIVQANETLKDNRSFKALQIAAVLACLGYLESGFDANVDEDVFDFGSIAAIHEGVPETYVIKYSDDPGLQKLMEIVADTYDMQDGIEAGRYDSIMAIGAGCTRHFVQHAIAA